MKTLFKHIVLASILSLSFFNCSKDDSPIQEEVNVQELLIGKWYFSESDGEPVSYCATQSYHHFLDESNMIRLDQSVPRGGLGECHSLFGEEALTYVLEDDNQTLVFTKGPFTYSDKIVSISNTQLVINYGTEEEPRFSTMVK